MATVNTSIKIDEETKKEAQKLFLWVVPTPMEM